MFIYLKNKKKLKIFGQILSKILHYEINIFLIGHLGAGKTTLCKSIISNIIKYTKQIKSPTYNILETYNVKDIVLNHLDLYKIKNLNELKNINLFHYISKKYINIIEWGEKFLHIFKKNIIVYIFNYSKTYNRILFINTKTNYLNKLLKK